MPTLPPAERRPPIRASLLTAVCCLLILSAGVWLGARHVEALPDPVADVFAGDDPARVVNEALGKIEGRYYREVPGGRLADDAIAGAVDQLNDRFSSYFTPKEYERFREATNSRFTGIGVTVSEHPRGLRVEQVFDGSPAKRARIVRGDLITKVGSRSLKGLTSDRASTLIRGPQGTDVTITLVHAGKPRQLKLTRSAVSVPVVASTLREVCGRKIGVVALQQFSSGAHGEVYAALRKLQKRGARAYVLDLRNNGGGLVDEAQLVASAFLRDGAIVTTRGRSVPERTLKASGDPLVPKAPLVVMVNRATASASEIVAGALQDRGRAQLVGSRTFGKGVFQEIIELSNGGALDITAGQYFTPKGRNLGGRGVQSGAGLRPDVAAGDDAKTPADEALRTGLDTVAQDAGCSRGAA